ncbi:MAG: hypothetical protein F4X81_08310 [Gammaproteobacteria bacterium]|nr:hypothetical protein [Gammaproteobacteria bacterium]MYE51458.1 hypothetical protein [Gammaproteobacteria bacterium]MYF49560.1 hypothetical protein [Gammaproteobacteria bacterium]
MHEYTLSTTRESDSGLVKYPYCFEANVGMPAGNLWREWLATLVDYRNSWLWPLRYSQPSVENGLVETGGRVIMTYQIPNPYDSSKPDKNVTHEFDITQFNEGNMFFEYLTTDEHTFLKGGGSFQVEPVNEQSCALTWQGEYRHATGDARLEAQGDAFPYYLCTFFTAAAQNIRKAVREGVS